MKTVEFYFDPISPYTWLAWTQLPQLKEKTGCTFRFVPVLLAGLLKAHGTKGPAEIPGKREYTFRDVMRWSLHLGKPLEGPPAHPFNPLKPLRMCVALESDSDREKFGGALLDSTWSRGLDVTQDSILLELAARHGLDGPRLLAKAQEPAVKDRLRLDTEEAVAKGIFGVPTFVVEGELFWGNNRLGFLVDHLRGKLPVDESKLAAMLSRPRAAERSA